MTFFLSALLFGLSCSVDGCVIASALTATLFGIPARRWALLVGCSHSVLLLLGTFGTEYLSGISEPLVQICTLFGTSYFLLHLFGEGLVFKSKTHCRGCSCHSKSVEPLLAFALSADSLIAGIALYRMFPSSLPLERMGAAMLSGAITGIVVFAAMKGASGVFALKRYQTCKVILRCSMLLLLSGLWIITAVEFLGGNSSELFEDPERLSSILGLLISVILVIAFRQDWTFAKYFNPVRPITTKIDVSMEGAE